MQTHGHDLSGIALPSWSEVNPAEYRRATLDLRERIPALIERASLAGIDLAVLRTPSHWSELRPFLAALKALIAYYTQR